MTERLHIARAIAQRPHIKGIVFQTVLSSRSLAERVEALLAWLAAEPLPKPLFVGIALVVLCAVFALRRRGGLR